MEVMLMEKPDPVSMPDDVTVMPLQERKAYQMR